MAGYFKNIYLGVTTLVVGMSVTFRHLFVPSVTLQYPKQKWPMPERSRNQLYVDIDDCIGCYQCERACPVDCIKIEVIKARPGEDLGVTKAYSKKKNFLFPVFDIDMAECCYCGLCVFPCPTDCIYWVDDYESSEFDRSGFIYHFGDLTPHEARLRREEEEKLKLEKTKAKEAAASEG